MGRASLLVWIACGVLVAGCGRAPVAHEHAAHRSAALGGQEWGERQHLQASDAQSADGFGDAIAMSGDTALVAAVGHNGQTGADYVLVHSGGSWKEQQKLTIPGGGQGDQLGAAIALDGDTALATTLRVGTGAWVFVRSGATWSVQQELLPGDGAPKNIFGLSAALSGDTAIVGAAVQANASVPGAAYVFVRSNGVWTEQQKLVPHDSAVGDVFGVSAALSGDTAFIAAGGSYSLPSAVYVFARSGSVWTEQQKLVSGNTGVVEAFGSALALDVDTAIVGATNHAYALARSGGTWSVEQELVSGGTSPFGLGNSVALSGDTALVGAVNDDNYGAAYAFTRSGTTWTEQQKIVPNETTTYNGFGTGVALVPGLALFGGRLASSPYTGEVFAFELGPADGSPCTANADCASQHCADGVCCDTACSAPCDACSVAAGATADGTCSVVAKGSPGSPSCAPLTCNGIDATCGCQADSDCGPDQACVVADQRCVPLGSPGISCTSSAGCAGFCVKGICCNEFCGGGCEVCSKAEGATDQGICTPVPKGSASCAGYACDGVSGGCPLHCAVDSDCRTGFHCSSAQTCLPTGVQCSADLTKSESPSGPTDCTPFSCNPATGKCESTCTDSLECADGYECDVTHYCVPVSLDGGYNLVDPNSGVSRELCACRAAGRRGKSNAPFVLLLGVIAIALRRRRA